MHTHTCLANGVVDWLDAVGWWEALTGELPWEEGSESGD